VRLPASFDLAPIMLGFAAVAMPLIAAVITAVVQADRLAQRNRQAVLDAETATHESRALIEHLTGMERSFGQYQVLGDRDFYLNYLSSRAGFDSAARQLAAIDLGTALADELRELVVAEARLNGRCSPRAEIRRRRELPQATDQWASLHELSRDILAESSKLITRHANKARDDSARLQRTLLLQTAAAVPVAVLLGLVFVSLIARPLRQIDAEIRRLGAGDSLKRSKYVVRAISKSSVDVSTGCVCAFSSSKSRSRCPAAHLARAQDALDHDARGFGLLLDDDGAGLSAEQREIAQIMRESGQHLQRLIEDLLQSADSDPATDPPHSGQSRSMTRAQRADSTA
jgi:two-component system sensor histidine kinase GlrK